MTNRRVVGVFSFLCSAILWSSAAAAQTPYVRGVVRDTNGEPISRAVVRAENPLSPRTIESETDDSGRFSFIGLRSGQWLFTIQRRGYETAQAVARIRPAGKSGTIRFTMEPDPSYPLPSTTGQLAGVRSEDLQDSLDTAHELFDEGDFRGALSAYQALLEEVPFLTSLHLQIGDAYREIEDFDSAEAAYRSVPPASQAGTEAKLALEALRTESDGR